MDAPPPLAFTLQSSVIRTPLTLTSAHSVMDAITLMQQERSQCQIQHDPTAALEAWHQTQRAGCIVVVDENATPPYPAAQVVGILTSRDIIRFSADPHNLASLPLRHVMSRTVVMRQESELTDLFQVLYLLQQHHIRHLPLLNDRQELSGLITHESLHQATHPWDLLRLRQVQEIMVTTVVCAPPSANLLAVSQLMVQHRVSSVVIVQSAAHPQQTIAPAAIPLSPEPLPPIERDSGSALLAVGVVTEQDLVQVQALGLSLDTCQVVEVMSTPVFSVKPTDSLWDVQTLMDRHWIHRLVVTDPGDALVGIVTQTSLLQAANPIAIYQMAEMLEQQVRQLQHERLTYLQQQVSTLTDQVQTQSSALSAQTQREQILADLTHKIRSSLSLETILTSTVSQVQEALQCERVTIWRFLDDGSTEAIAESSHSPISLLGERVEDTCFGSDFADMYREGQVRVVPDIDAVPMSDCHREMLVRLQTRAKILLPLLCDQQLWGLLCVCEGQHARDWQPEEVALLESLTGQLAIALKLATTHEQLQAELREHQQTEQRYREAQRMAQVGNWEFDLDTNRLHWSEEIFRIFELDTQEKLNYEHFLSLVHPEDRSLVDASYRQSLEDRTPYNLVHRLLLPDGRIKYVHENCETLYDADGTPRLSRGTVQDVTRIEQSNQALEQLNVELEDQIAIRTQELWQVNQLQKAILDSATYGIVSTDLQGIIQTFNPGAERLIGYSAAEVIGQVTPELFTNPADMHDHAQILSQQLNQAIPDNFEAIIAIARQGQSCEVEMPNIRKDGTRIMISISVSPLRDTQDQIMGFLGIFQDITARYQAEAKLRESQQFLQTVLDTFPLNVFWKDRHSVYLGCNQRFATRAGLESPQDIVGKTDFDLPWSQAESESYRADDRYVIDTISAKFEIRETQKQLDGSLLEIETNKLPLRNVQGEVIGVMGTYHDITEEVRAQQERQSLQERLEFLLDSSPAVIYSRHPQIPEQITVISENVAQILGYAAETWIQNSTLWIEHLHPEDREAVLTQFAQLCDPDTMADQSHRWEYRLRHARGHYVWICDELQLVLDSGGQIINIVGYWADISDRKATEATMKQHLAAVEAAINGIAILQGETYLYLNRAHVELFGYGDPSELLGQSWHQLYSEAELERFSQEVFPVLMRDRAWQGEAIAQRKDGSSFIEGLSLTLSEEGLLICVCRDITSQKQTEQIIQQQAKRETLLREISQRIRQSLDLQTIFDTACVEIRQVIQADRVGIFQFEYGSHWNTGTFVAESVVTPYSSVLACRVHDHCFGDNYADLYANGQFHVVSNIYSHGLTDCHVDILAQFQVKSNLVMPLIRDGDLWGLLCVHQCRQARHWSDSELSFIQQLANQLAIAIQQASLYDRVQGELHERQQAEQRIALQLRQQQTLGTIVQQVRKSLDIGEILDVVTHQVREVMNGDRVIVFQLFGDGRSRIVEESVGPNLVQLKNQHWDDETWSEEILQLYWQGKPRIVPDVMDDRWSECLRDYNIQGQIQSKIVAPILQDIHDREDHRWVSVGHENKLWGVLVVYACHQPRTWQQSEADLLQQIANQLAIAIQQAHLFEQLQTELTERQQAQHQLTERNQELAISNQELARATRLKDEFLANMSHELRTPLNAILGMTEGLTEEVFGSLNSAQIKALGTIERSGTHLLELINDILDLAKIESGQLDLQIQPTSVFNLCHASLTFIKQQAHKKQIHVQTDIPPSLPSLMIDERRVRQVLINLLNNAVKFTPDGGQVTLTVSQPTMPMSQISQFQATPPPATPPAPIAHPVAGLLRIAVTDTGIGIAPEQVQRLFSPFVQIDTALNRQYAGTGLGLALVRRIVEQHGGQVGLVSEVGQGSCFLVDLPCSETTTTADYSFASPNPEQGSYAPSPPHQPPLVLLAEDNEANISTLSNYLQAKGYRLVFAKNGEEAIAMARAESPDLILMDIQMPVMDGLEAMERLRADAQFRQVPIIALTALAMVQDKERCLAAGASAYLSKPVKLRQLVDLMGDLLSPQGWSI
jgi:PAS domain S-box-containing protein